MTGLDTEALREALRAGNDPGGALDLALIMDRGKRLRWRRRGAAVAGTLCALALLAGAGTGIADLASSSPATVQPVSPARPGLPGTRLPPPRTATAGPVTPVPVPAATPTATPTASPSAPVPVKSAPATSSAITAVTTAGAAGQPTPAVTGRSTGQPTPAVTGRSTGQPAAASSPPAPCRPHRPNKGAGT